MAAQDWFTLRQSLLVMLSQAPPPYDRIPDDFATLLPQATSYAEGRIYRELVPLSQRSQNTSLASTAVSRVIDLTAASQTVVTLEGVALIIPAGTGDPAAGTRVGYTATSLDVIDIMWPTEATTVAPANLAIYGRYWALRDDHTLILAPTPDAAYTAELTGLFAPTPISEANPTTYLSTVYPELLQAACMVFLTGALLRNFGAQADDPKMAASWEQTYAQTLLPPAIGEEQRRRMQGVGWSQNMPTPMAQPARA